MFRVAKTSDVEEIKNLAKNSGVFPYPIWIYLIICLLGWMFIYQLNNKIVGFVWFIPLLGFRASYLSQIAITAEFQGLGLGAFLLFKICKILHKHFYTRTVYVLTFKQYVVNWLRKISFKVLLNEKSAWVLEAPTQVIVTNYSLVSKIEN